MDLTVTITVTINRADNTHTIHTQTATTNAGDNPIYENHEIRKAITATVERLPFKPTAANVRELITDPVTSQWEARSWITTPDTATIHAANCHHSAPRHRQRIAYWSAPGDTINTFANWLKDRVLAVHHADCA